MKSGTLAFHDKSIGTSGIGCQPGKTTFNTVVNPARGLLNREKRIMGVGKGREGHKKWAMVKPERTTATLLEFDPEPADSRQ